MGFDAPVRVDIETRCRGCVDAGQAVYQQPDRNLSEWGDIGFFKNTDAAAFFVEPEPPGAIPDYTAEELEVDVARFLTQATFGARREDLDAMLQRIDAAGGDRIKALGDWIDEQFQMSSYNVQNFADLENERLRNTGAGHDGAVYAFWTHAVYGQAQLRQRMAFALSQILVASAEGQEVLRTDDRAMPAWGQMFLNGAFGSYRDLLDKVTYSPVMGGT